MKTIINTREDLEAIAGTQAYSDFMQFLKGSMTRKQNNTIYPDGYGQPDYQGPDVEPVWVDIEDLSIIERFGFFKSDFL
jgi:hypothetical protein